MLRLIVPITLALALVGCSNVHPRTFGPGDTGAEGDSDTDVDTDTDTDTVIDSGDSGETGPSASEGFDDPGDVVEFAGEEDVVEIALTDASGDSNQGQEFYLVVVNSTEAELGYQLRYYEATAGGDTTARPTPPSRAHAPGRAPFRPPIMPMAAPPPPPPLDSDDIGVTQDEFLVRDQLEDTTHYATVAATLWAIGENVEIWVDDDVAIDWDQGCDGTVDVPHPYEAYGFDNCDLADVAEIIDSNIIPNVRSLYGEESDINGDGRVSVVITPVLNAITLTSSDDDDFSRVLSSYAEPNVDLTDWDRDTNPGSDQQEVLYVFAPDPYGFFNTSTSPTVSSYTGYQLAAEVARSFTTLVSYNQHYREAGGAVEEDWVNDVLGTFAAEYCGFGAAYHEDAWEYLDAPHKYPLAADSGLGSLASLSRGAQYLFGLWLYEQAEAGGEGAGAALFAQIVQTDSTGIEAIEGAVASSGGTFEDLVVGWQVALLTSGVTSESGDPLVDTDEWAPYPAAETLSAPPSAPNGRYGANGYQAGLNLNGENQAFRYGTTDNPEAIAEQLVKLENTDAYIYTPGFEFTSWVDGNYAAQAVRLTGINYDSALARLQGTGPGLLGAVVRWNDPGESDLSIENSYSALETNAIALPDLPEDGSVVHGVGQISGSWATDSIDAEGGTESTDIEDTDRWLLDLTDRAGSDTVNVAVWLDRRFASTDGSMGPDDPWIAVAPIELVPEPTVDGTSRGDTCDGGEEFAYPGSLLAHLTAQLFLSSTMYDGEEDDFDACGEQATEATTCDLDWDRDGVLDEDEPVPTTFLAQTRVMECTQNGNVPPEAWTHGTDWLDVDEQDEDDLPSIDYAASAGGRSGVTGEEAYIEIALEGGREYLIVVGANSGGTGTYELSVRQVE